MGDLAGGDTVLDLVTLGEPMVVFWPEHGPMGAARTFVRSVAGAESNVAIGLARLGYRSGWIGRLGDDEFGRFVLRAIRGEGVDVSRVRLDPAAPTGVMFRESVPGRDPRVYYYRRGSAGSRLGPEDVDPEYVGSARLLHVTGITPALSPSCREAVEVAVEAARQRGVTVALDPNLRLKLWGAGEAAAALRPLIGRAGLVLAGLEEGERLSGRQGEEAVAAWLLEAGARLAVLKLGARGALATDGANTWRAPGFPVQVADTVGAGDAFAAGFYAAWLAGRDVETCLRYGNAAGALVIQVVGDTEGLPYRDELAAFLGEGDTPTR